MQNRFFRGPIFKI